MQLFITERVQDGERISLHDPRILYQLQKVLRAKSGEIFCMQDLWWTQRHTVVLESIDKTQLQGYIKDTQQLSQGKHSEVRIALPNKHKKIELIVQKLAEIGTSNILFRKSQRSQLADISPQKMERLQLIALEATEQSRNPQLPKISFCLDIQTAVQGKDIVVFDKSDKKNSQSPGKIGVIGPEGGLSTEDYELLTSAKTTEIRSLWQGILRTETAAIIAARQLRNE